MNPKLEAAIAYLRSRNKYILDPGNKLVWKSGADIAAAAKEEERRLKKVAEKPVNVSQLRRVP